jgi:hypothetical protein
MSSSNVGSFVGDFDLIARHPKLWALRMILGVGFGLRKEEERDGRGGKCCEGERMDLTDQRILVRWT